MYANDPYIQLVVPATQRTPKIIYNRQSGEISISGKSLPENTEEFYLPVFSLLQNFIAAAAIEINIKIQLEYINTSSCMCLLSFFKSINPLAEKGNKISVHWMHEEGDHDMIEKAKAFQDFLNFPIIALQTTKAN